MVGIYKITSPTGKVYIGQSRNIKQRINYYRRFRCDRQPAIFNSLKKYGHESHRFEIVCSLPVDIKQETLDRYEQYYIDAYTDSKHIMLNLKGGGVGGKLSKEAREKLSHSRKGMKFSEEHRRNLSKAHIGQKQSEKTKQAIKKANTGRKLSDKARRALCSIGRTATKETREKMSKSQKEYLQTTGTDKMVAIAKKAWENKEYAENQTKKRKALWADPVFKAKMSEIKKEAWKKRKK